MRRCWPSWVSPPKTSNAWVAARPNPEPRRGKVGKKIAWTEQANADLRALDQPTALRILRAMARFLATGEGDIKRLQDMEPPEFRLRVGDYRVRFHDLGDSILVLAVKHRRDAYR